MVISSSLEERVIELIDVFVMVFCLGFFFFNPGNEFLCMLNFIQYNMTSTQKKKVTLFSGFLNFMSSLRNVCYKNISSEDIKITSKTTENISSNQAVIVEHVTYGLQHLSVCSRRVVFQITYVFTSNLYTRANGYV